MIHRQRPRPTSSPAMPDSTIHAQRPGGVAHRRSPTERSIGGSQTARVVGGGQTARPVGAGQLDETKHLAVPNWRPGMSGGPIKKGDETRTGQSEIPSPKLVHLSRLSPVIRRASR